MEEKISYGKTMPKAPMIKVIKKGKTALHEDKPSGDIPEPYDERPSIRITESELPAVADWKVKGKYKLNLTVEMIGIHTGDYGRNKGKVSGEFKVTSIDVEPEGDEE